MISENALYWIWITNSLGYNNIKVKRLYELYDDIKLFYSGGIREWRFCGILSDKDINNLSKTGIESAEKVINRCNELGYSILAIDDEKFPQALMNINTPPAVI